jgi:tetratricopeptide (TPR) repeat protein
VRGTYEHRKRNFPKAVENFRKAVELQPEVANAHYNLGLALLENKQYDEANASAQRAYALGAELPGLRNRLEKVGRWRPDPAAAAATATPK